MFERFSAAGRAVLASAQAEARAFGHIHIGTEHLLLAMAAPPGGAATAVSRLLASHGVDVDQLRQTVATTSPHRSSAPVLGTIPLAPRTKKVLELAVQEAGSEQVLPEHVLLAILREHGGVAFAVLNHHHVGSEEIRALMNGAAPTADAVPVSGPLTPGARRVAELARQHAADADLGTQHLLLALLDERDGVAARVLADLGVDGDALRAAVAGASTAGTSDGEPLATVTVGDGVDVPIGDAELAARLRNADRDEVREIVRRALEEHLGGTAAEG